ncbi:ATP-dependent zinc metalloprotease YME1L-like [Homalodisca vitripennis]|uniref:ATP-dependent zinc metalloprotease YME1L-like n=1 Tax=Homalodisca vitripennis TaxID=197043 RepID=UPI001EEC3C61|nr:ATP-dependent zinc metalloprotease YME1L-like [Homalodisca vitripennis]
MFSFATNNKQSLTLNSQIGYVLNRRISPSGAHLGKVFTEEIPRQVNSCFCQFKRCFSFDSIKFAKDLLLRCSFSPENIQCKTQNEIAAFSFKFSKSILIKNSDLFLNKWSIESLNTENSIRFLRSQPKSCHLFNQIRSFKTGRHDEVEKQKVSRLYNRMRTFIGTPATNPNAHSHVRKDLESFHNKVSGENLTPEQSQRILLAFVEGYIVAKDSMIGQKSSWRIHHFFIAGVVAGILYTFFKKTDISTMFKTSNLSIEISESNVKFNDVKGAEEAKQELKNVVEFLKNPEKFSALGGKLPKGVLLVGPPGTGKTLLAKAVAGEAGVPFFSTSGPEFDEVYVGVGARRIRELFKLAKENIPCVIFIDEIDSIGKERTSSSLHPHANDTINQLLSEMDGFRNSGGIVVLGATNRREDLDRALLRPGRFDVEVTVLVPDFTGRKELIEFYLGQVRHQNVDTEKLARGTTNFTGADIENMVNQAALRAAVIGAQYVTTEHLEYARDKALMGPENISRVTDAETNRITAYHEGGHTVVAYFTENSQPLHKVTIIARGSSLGHTAYIPDKDIYHITKTQVLAMLDAMMGGRAAEELVFGSEKVTSGASSDLEKATELASKMVKRWGMSEVVGLSTYNTHNLISPQTANLIDMEVKKILQESYERAKTILITHRDKHKELSEALLKYETLNAEEIAEILNGNREFTKTYNKH